MKTDAVPNPGSDEAVRQGCSCPVLDNARGLGWLGSGQFWISLGCPVHCPALRDRDSQKEKEENHGQA